MRLWRGVSKCMVTCIFGGIDSTIMESSRQRELFNEVLLQGVFLEGQIAMLEGVKRRTSMCQAYYRTSYIRERNIVPVSSNFLTQISCGIKTKCRKTRAMQRDFTIVDSLALRQCNTSMIPYTHLLKLLFLARYTSRSIYQSSKNKYCKTKGGSKATLYVLLAPPCHLFYNIPILFSGAYA